VRGRKVIQNNGLLRRHFIIICCLSVTVKGSVNKLGGIAPFGSFLNHFGKSLFNQTMGSVWRYLWFKKRFGTYISSYYGHRSKLQCIKVVLTTPFDRCCQARQLQEVLILPFISLIKQGGSILLWPILKTFYDHKLWLLSCNMGKFIVCTI